MASQGNRFNGQGHLPLIDCRHGSAPAKQCQYGELGILQRRRGLPDLRGRHLLHLLPDEIRVTPGKPSDSSVPICMAWANSESRW
jgi:hypothetical protein